MALSMGTNVWSGWKVRCTIPEEVSRAHSLAGSWRMNLIPSKANILWSIYTAYTGLLSFTTTSLGPEFFTSSNRWPSRLRAFDGACFSLACRLYRPCMKTGNENMSKWQSGKGNKNAKSISQFPYNSQKAGSFDISSMLCPSKSAIITTTVHPY